MVVPTLSDLTFQFKDDGVLLNGDVLPFMDVTNVQGLDSATFRTGFKSTEGQDGGTLEADFEDTRTIVIEGNIYADNHIQLEDVIDDLKANYAPSRVYEPFYFKQTNGNVRQAFCKCTSGFRSDWSSMKRVATTKFQITLQCADTIIYGTQLWTLPGALDQSPAPGFSFPFSFPFSFGSTVTGPTVYTLTNYGNRPAPFNLRLSGSGFRNPTIVSDTVSRQLGLTIDIGATDFLDIDFGLRKVKLNGASRRGAVDDEEWFLLQPGDNLIRILIEGMPGSGIGSGNAIFTYYDAWR